MNQPTTVRIDGNGRTAIATLNTSAANRAITVRVLDERGSTSESASTPDAARALWSAACDSCGFDAADQHQTDMIEPLVAGLVTCRFIPVIELRVGDMVAAAEVIGVRTSASGKTVFIKVRHTIGMVGSESEFSQSAATRIAVFNR